jgi:hypothetical protein
MQPEDRAHVAASRHAVFSLPWSDHSPALARRHIEGFTSVGHVDCSAELLIVGSELVANAVMHGGEPIVLTLDADDERVTLEVTDGDARVDRVAPRQPDSPNPGGRGLRIIATLAEHWGVEPRAGGKAVWAQLPTHGESKRRATLGRSRPRA